MTFERLLAKSRKDGEPWLESFALPGHLADVHYAAVQVLDATAADQLRALELPADNYQQRLRRIVRLSAACHDLGKGNDHFQGMVTRQRSQPQGVRHEWVSLLMLETTPLRDWLFPVVGNETDWQLVLWAVAGHHPAYNRPSPPRLAVDGAGDKIVLLMNHPDFAACLQLLQHLFDLAVPPSLTSQTWPLVGPGNVFFHISQWHREACRTWDQIRPQVQRFVAALKNTLVAGDVAGSALPRAISDPAKRAAWIPTHLNNRPSRERLQRIVDCRLQGQPLRPFQEQVGQSTELVTHVRAGCGSGKTLAAYQWAASQHPGRRLHFCYPTTGTATEGFRDYLFVPEAELDADLFHGRAAVDLEIILKVDGDDDNPAADSAARIDSLDAWSTPIVSCTVDTVLGLTQNNRRGLYAWPALAGSAFVFDEIHAYDDRLFGALLRFLDALPGVPVLLMTASLPAARLRCLQQLLGRRGRQLTVIVGPPDLENRLRYQRQGLVDNRDPLPEIEAEIKRGGKVLWVCNTVGRVQAAAERAVAMKLTPLVYHSRFRYEDRVTQHGRVINAFREPGPVLAICSQVAEMSLDLSATLLITDLAPVPALIQRLGRLARWAGEGDPVRPFIVTEPSDEAGLLLHLPYTPEELTDGRRWLQRLGDGPLCQADLSRLWEEQDAGGRPAFVASAWLDGGPSTQVLELREASPGITVVMQRDAVAVWNGQVNVMRVALPMPPPPRGWRSWKECKGLLVAPEEVIDYSSERGARWLER